MSTIPVQAHDAADADSEIADASQPFLKDSPLGCVVKANPAYWNRPAVQAGLAAFKSATFTEAGQHNGDHAKAVTSPLGPGKEALRFDAQGNVIIRVAFVFSDAAVAKIGGFDRLVTEAKRILPEASANYQLSGAKLAFEYAGAQMLGGSPEGDLTKFPFAVSSVLDALAKPMTYLTSAGQPGQLEATQKFRQSVQANVLVAVATQGGGIAYRGTGQFDQRSGGLMAISFNPTGTPYLYSGLFAHEFGHVIGLMHGLISDGITDPANALTYRMDLNFPYAMGYEAFATGNAVIGVATLMTYNALNISWVNGTDERLSNPNQTISFGTVQLPLGEPEKSDSVQAINRDRINFAYGTTSSLQAWPVEVVEYHHAGLNQYFSTSIEDNIQSLDSLGTAKTGWARTGNNYKTVSLWGDASALLVDLTDTRYLGPVYRFYGDPSGPNTHFYTRLSQDVATLKTLQINGAGNPHKLHIEGVEMRVTAIVFPSLQNVDINEITCAVPGMRTQWTSVHRLFNNENGSRSRADGTKIDGNHRFAITPAIRAEMLAKGWVDEGVVWCVPPMR